MASFEMGRKTKHPGSKSANRSRANGREKRYRISGSLYSGENKKLPVGTDSEEAVNARYKTIDERPRAGRRPRLRGNKTIARVRFDSHDEQLAPGERVYAHLRAELAARFGRPEHPQVFSS